MSSPVDDILSSRLDVLENECLGDRILLDNCQESFRRINSERSDKFYNANMGLECRKNFNHKNCKSFILSDRGDEVAAFMNNYCGAKGNFLSKDCFTACGGDLKSVLTTCTNKSNIFVFILFIIWILMFLYLRISKYYKLSKDKKEVELTKHK